MLLRVVYDVIQEDISFCEVGHDCLVLEFPTLVSQFVQNTRVM